MLTTFQVYGVFLRCTEALLKKCYEDENPGKLENKYISNAVNMWKEQIKL
jgi:hypothetical protein